MCPFVHTYSKLSTPLVSHGQNNSDFATAFLFVTLHKSSVISKNKYVCS